VRTDPEVTAYVEAAPEPWRSMLSTLRRECRSSLEGFDERIEHGMPAYARAGTVEIAFANQKRYLSLYVLRNDVMDCYGDRLAGLDVGKGCIRYRREDQLDVDVVRSMLQATAASEGPICD